MMIERAFGWAWKRGRKRRLYLLCRVSCVIEERESDVGAEVGGLDDTAVTSVS